MLLLLCQESLGELHCRDRSGRQQPAHGSQNEHRTGLQEEAWDVSWGVKGLLQSPLSIWPELLLLPVLYLQLRHFKYKEQEICCRKIWVKTWNWKLPDQPAHTELSWGRSLCILTQICRGAARTMWYWGYLTDFTECCGKWLHKILCKYQRQATAAPEEL